MDSWALVTGASTGIGAELARLLAANRCNVVLVARTQARLEQLAKELTSQHPIQARVVPCDLSQPSAAANLFAAVRDLPISILVNNAGFGHYGLFVESDLAVQTGMMQTNMTALAELCHLFAQPMVERRSGRILNVASIAAFQPGPTVNTYYASKAFVYSFSYALAMELKGTGVTVTTLCPGTTRTDFFARANIHMKRPFPLMDPRTVAKAGYRGLMQGKRVVIPGLVNKIMAYFSPCLPSALTAAIVRYLHRPTHS